MQKICMENYKQRFTKYMENIRYFDDDDENKELFKIEYGKHEEFEGWVEKNKFPVEMTRRTHWDKKYKDTDIISYSVFKDDDGPVITIWK